MSTETETLEEYADRITADWPLPSERQRRIVTYNLFGIDYSGRKLDDGPTAHEIEERRKENERAEALREARKAALALTACDVCNLQPENHGFMERRGVESHRWTPGRAEKVLASGV